MLLWAAALAVGPLALVHFVGGHEVHLPAIVHLAAVGSAAAAATGASLALTVIGARRGDGRVVLVATAFTVMAAILLVHGLATPGFLVGQNGLVAFTGGATLPVGGAILALAAVARFRRPRRIAPLLWLQVGCFAVIGAVSALGMLVPHLVPRAPVARSPEAVAVLGTGLLFYGLLAMRAARTYLLTRRFADVLVVCGIAWLAVSLFEAMMFDYRALGWWIGHALEVAGIALVGAVVAYDLRRAAQSRPLIGDLCGTELVRSEEAFLGSHVRALMVRLADKDAYTEGHTRRVALLAVQVGQELGLPPTRLRILATGGLLHDIGKLSVPNEILRKPGPLDDDEYAVIRRHPERGRRLLVELGGFCRGVWTLVESHHERLDGSGYPHGLAAAELDLETRILGACDVYDALVSARVYRDAWTHEQALGLLREQAGKQFDERCVDAIQRVFERRQAAPAHAERLADRLLQAPSTYPQAAA
jgi:HD-GYP domain-containing protein (c-di-GMP phosphodiesterase class II)